MEQSTGADPGGESQGRPDPDHAADPVPLPKRLPLLPLAESKLDSGGLRPDPPSPEEEAGPSGLLILPLRASRGGYATGEQE